MKTNYISAILAGMLAIASVQACQEKEGPDSGLTQCLSPAQLSCDVTNLDVKFSWTVSKDAEEYNLVIASDEAFETVVKSVVVAPEEVPYTVTLDEGEYYFKVQATAEKLEPSNWSVYENVVVVEDTTPAVDLSASATANCYIVSKAGKYKFKPTQGATSAAVEGIAEVVILWETSTEDETATLAANSVIANVSYKDGYIEFATPKTFKPGNALIAAKTEVRKETDATTGETVEKQDVLWNWHIWLTSEPVTDVQVSGGLVLMDRNLGELSATARTSMLYQWGRKDPFPGLSGNGKKVAVAGELTTLRGGSGSLDWLIMNPTKLNGQLSDGEAKSCHASWTETTMWGTGADKTQYDPCPAGYKVPYPVEGDITDAVNDIAKTRFAGFSGMTFNSANGVFELGSAKFAATGCYLLNTISPSVASSDIQESGSAYLWTAYYKNKRLAGCLRVANETAGVSATYWSKSGDKTSQYHSKYNAYAVRCEKMAAN